MNTDDREWMVEILRGDDSLARRDWLRSEHEAQRVVAGLHQVLHQHLKFGWEVRLYEPTDANGNRLRVLREVIE